MREWDSLLYLSQKWQQGARGRVSHAPSPSQNFYLHFGRVKDQLWAPGWWECPATQKGPQGTNSQVTPPVGSFGRGLMKGAWGVQGSDAG